jgi:hypothetical protein
MKNMKILNGDKLKMEIKELLEIKNPIDQMNYFHHL